MAEDEFGLEIDDLRLLAGVFDAIEKDRQQFSADPRLVDVERRDLRVVRLRFGEIVEPNNEDIPRHPLMKQFERFDHGDRKRVVCGHKAIGELGHLCKQFRKFSCGAIGEGILLDDRILGPIGEPREEDRLPHGEEPLVKGGTVGIIAHESEVLAVLFPDEGEAEIFDRGKTLGKDDVVISRGGDIDGKVEKDGGVPEFDEFGHIVRLEQFHADDAVHLVFVEIAHQTVEKGGLCGGELQKFHILLLREGGLYPPHHVDEEGHRHQHFGGDEHDPAVRVFGVGGRHRLVAFIPEFDRGI